MIYILYAVGGLVLVVVAFFLWQLVSVFRGARKRDEKIMDKVLPLAEKLERKEPVSADEVASLAAQPQVRPLLYAALRHFEQLDLFPPAYLEPAAQGEAQLAYWMMHPHELQDVPEQVELVETVTRTLNPAGGQGKFFVYRYKMPAGHWAGTDWILGLAGPYFESDPPYGTTASAFSRCGDMFDEVKPNELVDWYIDMAEKKGAPWIER